VADEVSVLVLVFSCVVLEVTVVGTVVDFDTVLIEVAVFVTYTVS